jgi:hypothetical protein
MTLPTVVDLGRFEQTLLQAARAEMAPRDALHKSAAALGVSLPVIGLATFEVAFAGSAAHATSTTGALAATAGLTTSTPAGAAALATSSAGTVGAATVASQPIATATLVFLAKHVGAGVLAGALVAGGAHEASKAFDTPTKHRADTAVVAERHSAASAPAHRGSPVGPAPSFQAEPGSTAAITSSTEPATLATAARAPMVRGDAPALASREVDAAKAAGAHDAVAERTDASTPAGNVAAFPTEQSGQADTKTKLEAMPEPVGLDLERLLLARARRALAHGRPLVALRHLGVYSAKCAGGQLRAEANLVRVEALLRAGQRDKALWVARQEIERNSTRATVERVREMFQARGEPVDSPGDAGVPRQAGDEK